MKYRFDILRRRYQVARRPAWLSLDLHGRSELSIFWEITL